jgi:squalene-hopene/tetraprenyl-beta-curcumene cyclase
LESALALARNRLSQQFQLCDDADRPVAASRTGGEARGYWVGELEADTTLESDYIIFLYFLDPVANREKIRKLANYIRSKQLPDGSWNIYYGGPGEVSASVKAYFALKLAGVSVHEPSMVLARQAIISMGGVERVNSFTKIYLSFLNQMDWDECPAIPPEIVLLPRFFYFNIYEISYWSRAILVPLSILYARKPQRQLPGDLSISEIFAKSTNGNGNGNGHRPSNGNGKTNGSAKLFCEAEAPSIPRDPNLFTWRNIFLLIDRILKMVEKAPVKPLRGLALKTAERWMLSRFEKSDGLGAIFPAMVNSVMAMRSLGYEESHPHMATALHKLRRLEIEKGDTMHLQPCESPVWDTALAINALHEAGVPRDDPRLVAAARWLVGKEVRGSGDWQVRNPEVEISGWYFQFQNEFYPDVDDTSAVLMALERADLSRVEGGADAVRRGLTWVLSMQCSNGGWASFDVNVDRAIFTKFPFADHNAMLDPACADITGRVLEMFGRFSGLRNHPDVRRAVGRGIQYLRDTQDPSGAWYGRWGVNYLYGTWQSLKGLTAVGESPSAPYIRKAVRWLKDHQNPDGGWGESCASYDDADKKGIGTSTPSQTSWAIMALLACGEVAAPETRRGIQFLLDRQCSDGNWEEDEFTGTGFPCVFYLNYHLYRLYFPLFALGMYQRACGEASRVDGGQNARSPQVNLPVNGNGFRRPPRHAGARRRLRGFFGTLRG